MWYQLTIETCHRDEIELLSDAILETGALSITLTDKNDDPVLEPLPGTTPLWPDVIVKALYDDESMAHLSKTVLSPSYPHLSLSVETLPDQQWERVWMDEFKPQRFGERLWICPSWTPPPHPEAINLILDPGLAFGTGTHPTTSLCLTWLSNTSLSGLRVLDYGCGSGILALAAIKLGATHVQAIDIDEQALIATRSNAEINQIDAMQLAINFTENTQPNNDIVIANILLAPLLELKNSFYDLLTPKGLLVVSGILSEQVEELVKHYQTDFLHQATEFLDGWARVTLQKLEGNTNAT